MCGEKNSNLSFSATNSIGAFAGNNLGKIINSNVIIETLKIEFKNSFENFGMLVAENNGEIISTSIETSEIINLSEAKNVGGIAGLNNNKGTLQNVTAKTYLNGNENVGGVVGLANGKLLGDIKNEKLSEKDNYISGDKNIGGVVGFMNATISTNKGTLTNLINNTKVNTTEHNTKVIETHLNNNNTENITSANFKGENIGGVVGYLNNYSVLNNESGEINLVNNAVYIAGNNNVGGLVGYVESGKVRGQINTSDYSHKIYAYNFAGGAVGKSNNAIGTISISNNVSMEVYITRFGGGILGAFNDPNKDGVSVDNPNFSSGSSINIKYNGNVEQILVTSIEESFDLNFCETYTEYCREGCFEDHNFYGARLRTLTDNSVSEYMDIIDGNVLGAGAKNVSVVPFQEAGKFKKEGSDDYNKPMHKWSGSFNRTFDRTDKHENGTIENLGGVNLNLGEICGNKAGNSENVNITGPFYSQRWALKITSTNPHGMFGALNDIFVMFAIYKEKVAFGNNTFTVLENVEMSAENAKFNIIKFESSGWQTETENWDHTIFITKRIDESDGMTKVMPLKIIRTSGTGAITVAGEFQSINSWAYSN